MKIIIKWYLLLMASVVCFSACKKDNAEDEIIREEQDIPAPIVLDDNYVYDLPVVFHVFYQNRGDEKQYIPASKLATILDYVNQLYKGGVYGNSTDINVKFSLATTDESGRTLAQPGVEYVRYTEEYPIDVEEFMSDETKKNVKYVWDPNKYINVMVFPFKEEDEEGTVLGISHLPFKASGNATLQGLERARYNHLTKENLNFALCLSINSLFIDEVSTRYTNANAYNRVRDFNPADVVCTVAHELGHYLGLYHVFTEGSTGDISDSCGDTDYCLDTPSYNKVEYDKAVEALPNRPTLAQYNNLFYRTNCQGQRFQSVNIMDYAYNDPYQFTADQKYRIRQVLYYSPLIPGLKKDINETRSVAPNVSLDLPIRFIKDKLPIKNKKMVMLSVQK